METILESLNALLSSEKVTKIYYVDDAHVTDLDYKTVTTSAILQLGEAGKLSELVDTYKILDFSHGDADIINSKIDTDWESWEKDQQFYYFTTFSKIAERKADLEKASLMTLLHAGPFKDSITFLSPEEWITNKDAIISQAKEDSRIMILMDQELNLHAGTKGINLLKEIESTEFTYLTLFTYSITRLNEEVSTRNQMIEEYNLPTKSFFVLTKHRALDNNLFVDGIKKVLMNNYFDQMKDKAVKIVEEALASTIKELGNMDTHDFDLTVLKSSSKEGLWEPETLFRIMKIIFDKSIREEMVKQGLPPVINPLIRNARRVSESYKLQTSPDEYSKNYALRHREMYDESDIVNSLMMPIENGDIFEVTVGSSTQLWVLVGQECDLMVRSGGESATDYASLFKIDVTDIADLTDKIVSFPHKVKSSYMEKRFVLDYFERGTKKIGIVQLSKEIVVDRRVLDSVSINSDGASKINWAFNYADDHLSNAMIQRVKKIQDFLRKEISPQLIPGAAANAAHTVEVDFSFIPRFKIKNQFQVSNNEIDFGIKRLLRIRKPYSVKLLSKLMHMKARTADDHDFAEFISES